MIIDRERLEEIIDNWMDTDESGYTLADRIEEFIQEYIKEMIDSMRIDGKRIDGMRIFGTDEAAVEQLQKSGWMERYDAEITRNIGMQEFVNAVMANGDKSVMISINPWRWDE